MLELEDLKGCKVIVYSESGVEKLADSIILTHDRTRQILNIDGKKFIDVQAMRATLIIEYGTITLKCKGFIRHQDQDRNREVSLYKVQAIQDNRTSIRHKIELVATVERIEFNGVLMKLRTPLSVKILNISTSGIQLESSSTALDRGVFFQLVLNISGERTVINTSVVRIVSETDKVRRLGCSFLSLEQ